jgi:hypothetical protein
MQMSPTGQFASAQQAEQKPLQQTVLEVHEPQASPEFKKNLN